MSVAGEILRSVALSWQVQADELLPGPFAVAGISAGGKANSKGKDKDRDADRAEAEACVSRSAKLLLALSLQVLGYTSNDILVWRRNLIDELRNIRS